MGFRVVSVDWAIHVHGVLPQTLDLGNQQQASVEYKRHVYMKLRLAAIGLILVGVGAVALAVVGPSFAGSASSKYITSTVSTGTVSATSVANGIGRREHGLRAQVRSQPGHRQLRQHHLGHRRIHEQLQQLDHERLGHLAGPDRDGDGRAVGHQG